MNSSADIIVVGSGAAGIGAAISAARSGASTLLLDQRASAGGTGGFSGLTTLCGLHDDAGNFLNNGFAREFAESLNATAKPMQMGKVWALPYRPERFRELAESLFAQTPNLQTQWKTPVQNVVVKENRIVSLNGIDAQAVIDCTGTAEVARAINTDCLQTDETTQASAVVFSLHNVTHDVNTPAAAVQILLPLARAGFPPLNFQPNLEPRTLTVKFTGDPEKAREVIEFLRKNISGFENCFTDTTSFTRAQRAGRMIVGRYVLTAADVLGARKFSDAVARCAWPIEQWGNDGIARFKYLPAHEYYEIPARSLCAANVPNLFMAGKSISADCDAIASARVMGCCLATGEAAGKLAADYVKSVAAQMANDKTPQSRSADFQSAEATAEGRVVALRRPSPRSAGCKPCDTSEQVAVPRLNGAGTSQRDVPTSQRTEK